MILILCTLKWYRCRCTELNKMLWLILPFYFYCYNEATKELQIMHVAYITFPLDNIASEGHMISTQPPPFCYSILVTVFLLLLACNQPGKRIERMYPPKDLKRGRNHPDHCYSRPWLHSGILVIGWGGAARCRWIMGSPYASWGIGI